MKRVDPIGSGAKNAASLIISLLLLSGLLLFSSPLRAQMLDGTVVATEDYNAATVAPNQFGTNTSPDFKNTVALSAQADAAGTGQGVEFSYDPFLFNDEEITLHTFPDVAPGDYIIRYDINAAEVSFGYEAVISTAVPLDGNIFSESAPTQTVSIFNSAGSFQKRFTAQISIAATEDLHFTMYMSPNVSSFVESQVFIDNVELIKMNPALPLPIPGATVVQTEDYDAATAAPTSSGNMNFTDEVMLSADADVDGTGQGVEFRYTAFYNEETASIDLVTFPNVPAGTYFIQYQFRDGSGSLDFTYYNQITAGGAPVDNFIVVESTDGGGGNGSSVPFITHRTYEVTTTATGPISLRWVASELLNNVTGSFSNAIDNVQLMRVVLNTAPTAVCAAAFSIDVAGCSATITATQINNGSTDAEDDATGTALTLSIDPTMLSVGPNTVTLVVEDSEGATDDCTTTVTVNNTTVAPASACITNPVAISVCTINGITGNCFDIDQDCIPDFVYYHDGTFAGFSSEMAIGQGFFSAEAPLVRTANLSGASPSDWIDSRDVTWFLETSGGFYGYLTSSASSTDAPLSMGYATVGDVLYFRETGCPVDLPTLTCTDATVELGTDGTVTLAITDLATAESVIYGDDVVQITPSSLDCDDLGVNSVSVVIEDASSNEEARRTCTVNVTVTDPTSACNNAPIATCAAAFSLDASADDCSATITAGQINNGSSDPDAGDNITLAIDITNPSVGANTVTLTVTDQNSASSTCTTEVTVVDVTPPTAVCADITVELNETGEGEVVSSRENGIRISANGNTTPSEVGDVTSGGSDGNCTLSNFEFGAARYYAVPITVTTAGTYTFTGYSDQSMFFSLSTILYEGEFDVADPCNNLIYANTGAPIDLEAGDYTFVAATLTTNATPSTDEGWPLSYSGPANVEPRGIMLDGVVFEIAGNPFDGGSTDNCGAVTITPAQTTFTCADLGENMITVTVTDGAGNTDECVSTVTVVDNIAPTIECRDTIVNLSAEGTADVDFLTLVTSVDDNCSDGLTLSSMDNPRTFTCSDINLDPFGGVSSPQTITNAVTVTDASGRQASCDISVEVRDVTPPTANCPEEVIIYLDEQGVGDSLIDIPSFFTDACGIQFTDAAFTAMVDCNAVDNPGGGTFVASDMSGNGASCSITITVLDTIAPQITCATDTVYLDADGFAIVESTGIESISDNCSAEDIGAATAESVDCSAVGMTFSFPQTVSDPSGNTASCTSTVLVLDTIRPTLTCQPFTVQLDETGAFVQPEVTELVTSVTDNCTDAPEIDLTSDFADFTLDCTAAGTATTVTVTATDANGNVSNCSVAVTVEDNVDPTPIVVDTTLFLDVNGMASLSITDFNAEDNCTGATITDLDRLDLTAAAAGAGTGFQARSAPVVTFDCADAGQMIDVQAIATDASGNTGTAQFTVTVLDTIAPVLTCSDTTIILEADATVSYSATANVLSVLEACPADITVGDPVQVFTCDELGENTVTATRTDASGNTGSCTITVTVTDPNMACNAPPEAVCQDLVLQVDADGNVAFTAADLDGGSTDDMTPLNELVFTADFTAADFSCADVGQPAQTVTLTVADDAGLTSTCTSQVTVEDNIAPVVTITAAPVMINLTDAMPTMDIVLGQFATVTDNCDEDVNVVFDRPLTFGGADIGSSSFELTATDDSGNPTTVTINVVVTFDQPNLACIGDINLTLNDDCQGLVIPSMVLTGNTALNDFFNFDIVVQDSDPSNGPIVDGCGEFVYTISQRSSVQQPASLGFTGFFAGANWTDDTFLSNPATQTASVNFTASTATLTTSTTDVFPTDPGSFFFAQTFLMIGEMGTVTLDYAFNGVDAPFDQFIVITDFEGATVDGIGGVDAANGSLTLDIQPGYSIFFGVGDDGFQPGAENNVNELTISNFVFTPRPATDVLDLDFESCWGIVRSEDKTPPAVAAQIAPIDLLCVDLDDNQVSLLDNTVDRCYEVFSATGNTVPGTMATALRNALSANVGSSAAVVPTFTDGCTERLEVCVSESIVFDAMDPNCNDVVLTRTFTATEIAICPSASGESNGSTVSSYVITFSRPSLDDLDSDNIEDVANYDRCGVTTGTIADIRADYPAPRSTDFPFLAVAGRTFPLQSGSAVCNIGVTFADGDPIITCPNTYKFVRTYTVIDWCTPDEVETFTQVVKVGDTEAPTFTGPTQDRNFDGVVDGDLIFNTNAGNVCAAYLILDGPGVGAVDNCDDDVTITATIFPGGDLSATPIGAFDVDPNDGNAEVTSPIPVGTHILRYTFSDDCGNSDFADFEFTVVDGTAPVAICEDGLNISITAGSANGGASTGIAILTPSMIDAGSYDDCSGVMLEIARVNGSNVATEAYDQELILTCSDLGTVRVGLQVTDELGNRNFCWLDVLVEDKNIPTCIPPGPMTLTCVDYRAAGLPADITEATEDELNVLFGSAVGIDNCEVTVTSTVSGNVNSCGIGNLTRNFLSTDGEGFVDNDNCVQRISITGIFDYRITFPTDEESGCADIPAFDGLATDEFACDLITVNVSVDTIAAVNAPDACFTLRVNYDVINFCEYNQLGECYRIPRDGDGIRNPDTQLLYLNVIPNNTANTEDDIAFLSRFTDRNFNGNAPQRDQLVDDGDDNDGSDDDNDNDSEDSQAANGVGFAYAQDDSRGFFCYVQFVDVYDNDAPVITGDTPDECFAGTSIECEAEVTLTFTAEDECTSPVVTVELDANYISGSFVPTNPASVGVGVSVSNDGANYTVNATNVPVGTHAIRVRANDGCGNFDTEVIVFCVEGDKAPTPICIQTLTVTLMPDGMGDGMAEIWASDFIASDVVDCFGNVIDKYSMYTEEEAGAAGFAPAAGDLGVSFTCADFGESVPVRVYAIADNGSADYCSVIVEVQAFQEGLCETDGGNLAGTILTQNDEAVAGVEVTLTGANYMDVMVVTTATGAFSFVNLPENIDYTIQPNHPVAVDLNRVTVADVVAIGNAILGIEGFASNYDYLVADVDQDQSLTVGDMVSIQRVILGLDDIYATGESWGFVPMDVDVSNPYAQTFPEVFNANDLVGNVVADFVGFAYGDVNSVGRSTASLEVEDTQLEAGQTHLMELSGEALAGFQGTLALGAGLELVDVTYTGEGGLNLNEAASGRIAMIFRTAATVTVELRATESGLLSDLVRLTDDITLSEGVNANGTGGALHLAFNNSNLAPAAAHNALLQNTPNPVTDATTIRFELATAGPATLTLRDAAGRLLSEQKIDAIAGMNRIELVNLNASGVISYTLTAGEFTATRKMVVVR